MDAGGQKMPSRNYTLFEQAMRQRKPLHCMYDGFPREICPIVLGHSHNGEEKALTFQFAGGSGSGLLRGGEWRCLSLSKIRGAKLRDGRWTSGSSHTQPQKCVDVVDLDVNPTSPYQPKRKT
jgi:hypothetical protein